MRKLLILAFAAALLVAFAAPSFAAETTFNGQYKIRAWSNWNFDKRPGHITSERGRYDGYFDQRFRLTITHTRSEFLKAVVQIDLVEDVWGQQRNFRINNNTSNFIRKAYIEFTLPKVGTFTLGKQPVVLGYGLAFSDSSGYLDGVKWSNKWGPVGVSAMYFKWDENIDEAAPVRYRDTDIWLLDVAITPNDNHTIELFGGYVNARTGYPQTHWLSDVAGPGDLIHANVGLVGIAYTGEIADMVTLKGEFSYLFGRADLENWGVGYSDHAHLTGYNLYLDASYHNDLLRVGAAFVTGSGQQEDMAGANHYNINFLTADEFVFGNIIASGNGGMEDDFGGGLGFCDDIENLTAAKLYFEIYPLCCDGKLSLNAAVIWARWTEHVGQNTPYDHPVEYYGAGPFTPWYGSKTDLGWEIDFGLNYEIMEGLTYSLAAGVLFTGESFDYSSTGHQEWGPMWTVNNNLIYEF